MDHDFWHTRWEQGQIGFHQPRVNPDLQTFWSAWLDEPHHRILVPLSGKSVDLPFLAGRGHDVTGVELSAKAVAEFHQEQGLRAFVEKDGPFTVHTSSGVTIYNGDFFALDAARIGTFDRAWDRGALVAMDAPRRPSYVATLRGLLRPGARVLLSVFDYPQERLPGPPWSVPLAEVEALWAGCRVEQLLAADVGAEPRFKDAGLHEARLLTCLIHLPG